MKILECYPIPGNNNNMHTNSLTCYTTEDPIVKARLVEAMETILNKASVSLSYTVVMVTPFLPGAQ